MQLQSARLPDLLVISVLETRIDAASAIEFKEKIRALTAGLDVRIMMDLSRVTFIDSSGLGAVVAVHKSLGPGRRLELAPLTPSVDRVFRLTRMDRVFRMDADLPVEMRDVV